MIENPAMIENNVSHGADPHRLARLTTRVILEFGVAASVDLVRMFEGFPDLGLALCTLLRIVDAPAHRHPGWPGQTWLPEPVSISALAAALSRPFETVREHVNRLAADGWCERTRHGLVIPPAALDRPEVAMLLDTIHDRFVGLIGNLKTLGYPLPRPKDATPDLAQRCRLALEFLLKVTEMAALEYGGWVPGLIFLGIMVANARPLTFDPALARQYARVDTPPPEAMRAPVGLAPLCRALALPDTTVRRHVRRHVAGGHVVQRDGRLIIPIESLQAPTRLAQSSQLNARLAVIVDQLAATGFPFADAASAYLCARPTLLDFG